MTKQEIIDKLDDYLMYVPGDEEFRDFMIITKYFKKGFAYSWNKDKLNKMSVQELKYLLKQCNDYMDNLKPIVLGGTTYYVQKDESLPYKIFESI